MVDINNKLLVFESFRINYTLPKFNRKNEGDTISMNNSRFNLTIDSSINGNPVMFNDFENSVGDNEDEFQDVGGRLVRKDKQSIFIKLFNKYVLNHFREKKRTKTIVGFFASLATSLNELVSLADVGSYYQQSIQNAKNANQIALFESLTQKYGIVKSESLLIAKDLNKYLTEEQIVDFYNKTDKDKNLKLTWLNNYIRPIPTKLIQLKNDLDSLDIFDNYAILHYDPQNNSTDLTEEEKIRKKDPILFGLIRNSRKLYYIGDWIDEYCDLTLEKLIETVKADVNEINNSTVKTFIDS